MLGTIWAIPRISMLGFLEAISGSLAKFQVLLWCTDSTSYSVLEHTKSPPIHVKLPFEW